MRRNHTSNSNQNRTFGNFNDSIPYEYVSLVGIVRPSITPISQDLQG